VRSHGGDGGLRAGRHRGRLVSVGERHQLLGNEAVTATFGDEYAVEHLEPLCAGRRQRSGQQPGGELDQVEELGPSTGEPFRCDRSAHLVRQEWHLIDAPAEVTPQRTGVGERTLAMLALIGESRLVQHVPQRGAQLRRGFFETALRRLPRANPLRELAQFPLEVSEVFPRHSGGECSGLEVSRLLPSVSHCFSWVTRRALPLLSLSLVRALTGCWKTSNSNLNVDGDSGSCANIVDIDIPLWTVGADVVFRF